MQYSDMREWANEIVAVFPKEKKEFYFLERKMGKKNPSGKLFSRWANVIKLENKANSVTQEAHEAVFDDNVLEKSVGWHITAHLGKKLKSFGYIHARLEINVRDLYRICWQTGRATMILTVTNW